MSGTWAWRARCESRAGGGKHGIQGNHGKRTCRPRPPDPVSGLSRVTGRRWFHFPARGRALFRPAPTASRAAENGKKTSGAESRRMRGQLPRHGRHILSASRRKPRLCHSVVGMASVESNITRRWILPGRPHPATENSCAAAVGSPAFVTPFRSTAGYPRHEAEWAADHSPWGRKGRSCGLAGASLISTSSSSKMSTLFGPISALRRWSPYA